ncbi:MAG: DEAD/DEAH box helicase [Deltaproteobacteria bacterium]|jgi:ATP-dependent RNA helicase RhlE|nr:DEAD/DEAH box helicase [Deltaproteobacteria bacterium]
MSVRSFTELSLLEPIQRAVQKKGYETPTPIQAQAIPHLLEGRDLLGIAQTGTGKTAAFALPMIQHLSSKGQPALKNAPRALILTPTRELAAQIGQSFKDYGTFLKVRHAVIYGGVGQQPQVDALRRGVDVLIATPGRLLDLMQQRHISLQALEIFVLDEADRMLDMGFIHDVKRVIAAIPKKRQTLFFSATMPPEISKLADSILTNPVKVEVTPPATTVERIEQRVLFVDKGNKTALLTELLKDQAIERSLVFTRTKHGANRVAEQLKKKGIEAEAIHGNKSQSARERALAGFKAGKVRVLVATDIAARGIDVPGITHVINFDLPNVPESYVHRIGRTARAGKGGFAISFCDHEERAYLRDIERVTRQKVPVIEDHPFRSSNNRPAEAKPQPASRPPPPNRHRQSRFRPRQSAGHG